MIFYSPLTGAHIHICDFHREKAWSEWLSKSEHGVSESKAQVLDLLRAIANSPSLAALEKNVATLKLSEPWKKSLQLRSYFDFWGKHMKVSD